MERRISIYLGTFQRRYGVKQALEIAKNSVGVNAVDFTLSHYTRLSSPNSNSTRNYLYAQGESAVIEYFSEIKEYADSLGITVAQTHGRGTGLYGDAENDEACLQDARLDCIATRILGAKHCVMHGPPSYLLTASAPEKVRELHFKMFSSIIPHARENKIKIAYETGGNSGAGYKTFGLLAHADEFIKAYERLAAIEDYRNWFCCCVDTGHSNMAAKHEGEPTVADLTRRLGSAVEVLHINDNEGLTDMHAIPLIDADPLTGSVDWWDFMKALDEISYQGYYNLELGFNNYGKNFAIEEAIFAVKVMKNILFKHYKKAPDGFGDDSDYLIKK
ncbi:MAG: hypothetical protein E7646_07690 [Ruminococcaceae bacterium]|nr:hypothetical protein [Oscillospiraceae bacterium]